MSITELAVLIGCFLPALCAQQPGTKMAKLNTSCQGIAQHCKSSLWCLCQLTKLAASINRSCLYTWCHLPLLYYRYPSGRAMISFFGFSCSSRLRPHVTLALDSSQCSSLASCHPSHKFCVSATHNSFLFSGLTSSCSSLRCASPA